jgi:hypothetical protein
MPTAAWATDAVKGLMPGGVTDLQRIGVAIEIDVVARNVLLECGFRSLAEPYSCTDLIVSDTKVRSAKVDGSRDDECGRMVLREEDVRLSVWTPRTDRNLALARFYRQISAGHLALHGARAATLRKPHRL